MAAPAPLDFNQPIPELTFDLSDESAIDSEVETPVASTAPAEAPEESRALPDDDLTAMDFSDIAELPNSVFAAAEGPEYQIPELDFGEDVAQSILTTEAFDIPDLGIAAPPPTAKKASPAGEAAPKQEPIAEAPQAAKPAAIEELSPSEEPPAPIENRKRPVRKKKGQAQTEAEITPPTITPVKPYPLPRGRAPQPVEPLAAEVHADRNRARRTSGNRVAGVGTAVNRSHRKPSRRSAESTPESAQAARQGDRLRIGRRRRLQPNRSNSAISSFGPRGG